MKITKHNRPKDRKEFSRQGDVSLLIYPLIIALSLGFLVVVEFKWIKVQEFGIAIPGIHPGVGFLVLGFLSAISYHYKKGNREWVKEYAIIDESGGETLMIDERGITTICPGVYSRFDSWVFVNDVKNSARGLQIRIFRRVLTIRNDFLSSEESAFIFEQFENRSAEHRNGDRPRF